MKREPNQPDQRETLSVSVSTVEACVAAASPTIVLSAEARASFTLRGLLSEREPKHRVVANFRRCDAPMQVGGRVFPKGRRGLSAWVNLPPVVFADALVMALSGQLTLLELTTEKLRRNTGAVLAARFVTRELRSDDPIACLKGGADAVRKNPAAGGPTAGP
jgi:hypothetical protein